MGGGAVEVVPEAEASTSAALLFLTTEAFLLVEVPEDEAFPLLSLILSFLSEMSAAPPSLPTEGL